MCYTQILDLSFNKIGDPGIAAFADALGKGALASLELLNIAQNKIGDDGLTALAGALSSGALASLRELHLFQDAPALKAACQARGITFY